MSSRSSRRKDGGTTLKIKLGATPSSSKKSSSEERAAKNGVDDEDIQSDEGESDVDEVDEDSDSSDAEVMPAKKARGPVSYNKAAFSMADDIKKLMDRVLCCSCGKQLNPMNTGAIRRHPWLKVVTCKKCYKFLKSGAFTRDKEGTDEQCRWCGDGGRLYGCDYCHNCFCRSCIKRNLGRSEAAAMENEEFTKWKCYVCKPKKLKELVGNCTKILDYIKEQDDKEKARLERARIREEEKAAKAKLERDEKKKRKEKSIERSESSKESTPVRTTLPKPKPKVQNPIVVDDSPLKSVKKETAIYKVDANPKPAIPVGQRNGSAVKEVVVGPRPRQPVTTPYANTAVAQPISTNKPKLMSALQSVPVNFSVGGVTRVTPPANDIAELKNSIYPFNIDDTVQKMNTVAQSLMLMLNSVKTDLAIAKLQSSNMFQARNSASFNMKNGMDVFFNSVRDIFKVQIVTPKSQVPGDAVGSTKSEPVKKEFKDVTSTEPIPIDIDDSDGEESDAGIADESEPVLDPTTGKMKKKQVIMKTTDSDEDEDDDEDGDECCVVSDPEPDYVIMEVEDDGNESESSKEDGSEEDCEKEGDVSGVTELSKTEDVKASDKKDNDKKNLNAENDKDKSEKSVEKKTEDSEKDKPEEEEKTSSEMDDSNNLSKEDGKNTDNSKNKLNDEEPESSQNENTAAELEMLKELTDELNDDEPRRSRRTKSQKESKDQDSVAKKDSSSKGSRHSSPSKKSGEKDKNKSKSSKGSDDSPDKSKKSKEISDNDSDVEGKSDKRSSKHANKEKETPKKSHKKQKEDDSDGNVEKEGARRSSRQKTSTETEKSKNGESENEAEKDIEKSSKTKKSEKDSIKQSKSKIEDVQSEKETEDTKRRSGRQKNNTEETKSEESPDKKVKASKAIEDKEDGKGSKGKTRAKGESSGTDDYEKGAIREETSGSESDDSDSSEGEVVEFGRRKKKRKGRTSEASEKTLRSKAKTTEKSDDKKSKSKDKSTHEKSPSKKVTSRNRTRQNDASEADDGSSDFDADLEKEIKSLSKSTKLTKTRRRGRGSSLETESIQLKKDKKEDKTSKGKKSGKAEIMFTDSDQDQPSDAENNDDQDEEEMDEDQDDVPTSKQRKLRGERGAEKSKGYKVDKSNKKGSKGKNDLDDIDDLSSSSDVDRPRDEEDEEEEDVDEDDLSPAQLRKLRQAKEAEEEQESEEEEMDQGDNSDDSTDPDVSFPKLKTKGKKGGGKKKGSDSEIEELEFSDDSDFASPKKKRKRVKDKLLDEKISGSESDDGAKKKKGKGKKRKKKEDSSVDSEDEVYSDNGKKKKKRKRIKKVSSSEEEKEVERGEDDPIPDDSDEEDGGGGFMKRKKIRKVMKNKKLADDTKAARKAEEERRKRIEDRQKEFNSYVEVEGGESEDEKLPEGTERENREEPKSDALSKILGSPKKVPITTKCILEMDKDKKKPLIEVNRVLVRKLKPHQVEAVRFMYNCTVETIDRLKKEEGSGAILAHCMGLGKTLSVITFTHTMLSNHKLTKMSRCLVVCPLNTVLNWVNEFELWLGDVDFEIDVYEMSKVKQNFERAQMLKEWHEGGAGVMILGYDMYRNLVQGSHCKNKKQKKIFYETLADPGPDMVVCDEGHILKNDQTTLSKAMNKIISRRRIVLTGTPLQNNLGEYHCMMNFVKPNLLGTKKEFSNRFANPITNGQSSDATPSDVKLMKRRAHILHELLAGCVQRKDYSALTKFLPPKYEYVISVRLSKVQMTLYEKYLQHGGLGRGQEIQSKGARLFKDYQALMRIWTHPWVLKLDEIRQENKRPFDDSEDSFIDDTDEDDEDSFISDGSTTPPSDEEELSSKDKKKGKKKKRRGRGRGISDSSDSDSEKQKDDDDDENEVVNKWTSRRRGNEEGAGSSWMEDMGYAPEGPREVSSQWWAEYVKEEDEMKLELSGKLMLMFEILKMSEDIGDKVLIFSQSLLSLDIIEDFLHRIDEAHNNPEGEKKDEEGTEGKDEEKDKEKDQEKDKEKKDKSDGDEKDGGGEGEDKEKEDKEKEDKFAHYGKSWTKGGDYFRMDGSTNSQQRKASQDMFNDPENYRARLFLISTKAGSLGINLVAANRVIIFDASWNPSHDIQSIFRVYRFGQVKPVYVYRFLAQGTMEEKIYERQVTKQSLAQRVVDEHQIERHFTSADLQELYHFTPDRLDDPNRKEQTPMVPKDHMLAELSMSQKEWIVTFHEHDSLLENLVEHGLSEEEKKAAWEDYENEKKGIVQPVYGNMGANMYRNQFNSLQHLMLQGQANLGQAAVLQIVQDLKSRFPNLPPEIFQQRVQAVLRQVLTQQMMQQSEMQRRQQQAELQQLNRMKQQIQQQQAMISNQQRALGIGGSAPYPTGATGTGAVPAQGMTAYPASGILPARNTSYPTLQNMMQNVRMNTPQMGQWSGTSASAPKPKLYPPEKKK